MQIGNSRYFWVILLTLYNYPFLFLQLQHFPTQLFGFNAVYIIQQKTVIFKAELCDAK